MGEPPGGLLRASRRAARPQGARGGGRSLPLHRPRAPAAGRAEPASGRGRRSGDRGRRRAVHAGSGRLGGGPGPQYGPCAGPGVVSVIRPGGVPGRDLQPRVAKADGGGEQLPPVESGRPGPVPGGVHPEAVRRRRGAADRPRRAGWLLPVPAGVHGSRRHVGDGLPQLEVDALGLHLAAAVAGRVVRHGLLPVRIPVLPSAGRPWGDAPATVAEVGLRPPHRRGRARGEGGPGPRRGLEAARARGCAQAVPGGPLAPR